MRWRGLCKLSLGLRAPHTESLMTQIKDGEVVAARVTLLINLKVGDSPRLYLCR